jgi:hypothetical protein
LVCKPDWTLVTFAKMGPRRYMYPLSQMRPFIYHLLNMIESDVISFDFARAGVQACQASGRHDDWCRSMNCLMGTLM